MHVPTDVGLKDVFKILILVQCVLLKYEMSPNFVSGSTLWLYQRSNSTKNAVFESRIVNSYNLFRLSDQRWEVWVPLAGFTLGGVTMACDCVREAHPRVAGTSSSPYLAECSGVWFPNWIKGGFQVILSSDIVDYYGNKIKDNVFLSDSLNIYLILI